LFLTEKRIFAYIYMSSCILRSLYYMFEHQLTFTSESKADLIVHFQSPAHVEKDDEKRAILPFTEIPMDQ